MNGKKAVKKAFRELSSHYEETVDDELRTFWGWSYQGFVDRLIEQTPIKPHDKILDVATGTAVIPRMFVTQGADQNQFVGLDITEAMLHVGQQKINGGNPRTPIHLTCGDAMSLPFPPRCYDVVVSGLATHHMDIKQMLAESFRVLKVGGSFSIVDVGVSPFWQSAFMRIVSRIFAFVYFLFKENISRAWAEAEAVTNVWTAEDWHQALAEIGFQNIEIKKVQSGRKWIPDPLAIKAKR